MEEMEESNKLPLKRVELSLTKFNEVAIPHHLDLLRQHKVNIVKLERAGEAAAVAREQARARLAAAQLRALLAELEALRRRVRRADLPRFDALTQRSRDLTLRAVVDYLGVIESSCRALVRASGPRRAAAPGAARAPAEHAEHAGTSPPAGGGAGRRASSGEDEAPPPASPLEPLQPLLGDLQLHVDDQEAALREREAALRGWAALQGEVRALHEAWQHVQAAALHQRADVAAGAAAAHVAADNVEVARRQLSAAERLRASAWLCGGAVCGALAGGPVGLAVGLKAGAAAALAGSLLGALGLRALAARPPAPAPAPADPADKDKGD